MRASSGLSVMCIAAALAAAPLFAQAEPTPETQPQQPQTVGPRELRDFSLPGTTPAPENRQPATAPPAQPEPAPQTRPQADAQRAPNPAPVSRPPASQPAEGSQELRSQPLDPVPDPVLEGGFATQPSVQPVVPPPSAAAPVPQAGWGMMPWLAAALLAALGAAFLVYRRRSRSALANAASLEAFVPVEPPAPVPPASPRTSPAAQPPAAPASHPGIVSARLRPALELDFTPSRCIIDDRQATIEFAITAMNSGNAPARDIRIEVAIINAGPAQDREIARFFEDPAGVGEPLEVIPPMRSINLNSRVSMPFEQVRAFEAGGRRLFVPLLAFNALYRWSGGEGQTSLSFLVGRDGEGDKMAPFRLDLGPRVFRKLGARPHHMRVQR